jgi:hypothetical protein
MLYLTMRLWMARRSWALIGALGLLAAMVAFVVVFEEPQWLSGMKGNVAATVVGGVVFLLLGLHFSRKVEGIILRRAEIDDQRDRMNRFIRFLESELHYNVCFPGLASEANREGLVYRLEPVRHEGKAVKRETEIDTLYLVKVARPAYEEVLEPEQRADYERSPVKIGARYFCDFYNAEWHLGASTARREWLEFHLFGKEGEMEHSVTAEEFCAAVTKGADGR